MEKGTGVGWMLFLGMVDFSEELKFEERRKGSNRSKGWKGRSRFTLQSWVCRLTV